jgi:3-hydroxyisobutyrate dehydrogenase-like beta-hydroxyacid dehydrogenase
MVAPREEQTMALDKINGIIGVGYMGRGMAKKLIKAGYSMWIKGNGNRTPINCLTCVGAREPETDKEKRIC